MNKHWILGREIEDIKSHTKSKLVFTYRLNFINFRKIPISEDVGWGCTIRCGQMLIGNTIIRRLFGDNCLDYSKTYGEIYLNILSHFNDNYNSVFSIHNFTTLYPLFNKKPGDWIGPYTLSKLLTYFNPILENLYQIKHINCENEIINYRPNKKIKSYLITIPLRLGVDKISDIYYKNIIEITKLEEFMGIIGGSNHSSYYIIGSTNDKLNYLDPHHIHTYNEINLNVDEYHCDQINLLNLCDLQPTITLCFYTRNINTLIENYNKIDNICLPRLHLGKKNSKYKFNCQSDSEWELLV